MKCRHCKERKVRPDRKGLCWGCSLEKTIRDLYPPASKFGRRGVGHADGPLPQPTLALPGTEEKIAVMEQRAALGLQIFHPGDAARDCTAHALAFNQGCDARLRGEPIDSSPFNTCDEKHLHDGWDQGWRDVTHNWGSLVRGAVPPLPPIQSDPEAM